MVETEFEPRTFGYKDSVLNYSFMLGKKNALRIRIIKFKIHSHGEVETS